MKKLLLPFLLLFSGNILAENLTLDGPFLNLGYLDSVNGLPFNQTFTLTRTEATPETVVLNFSYTQVEMICEDRIPDYGGGYGGPWYGPLGVNGGARTTGHEKHVSVFDHHSYHGFDRNFMGICRHWGEMETQKSGRVKLIFRTGHNNDSGDIIKVSIQQRDLHSTAFYVSGWCSDPVDYYEITNHDRTIIFE